MNPPSTFDQSQRKLAGVAGFAFVFAMAIVVVSNYGINFRLIVPGNAVDTARNIMANETLFRLNIACNIVYVASVVVLLTALFAILEPVDRSLALFAAVCRLIYALMWGMTALNTLGSLRLLGGAAYLPVFTESQLHTLARLLIHSDAYYIGLPFWGLASTVCSYLWFRSRYVPGALAVFGLVTSAWCVLCALAFIVFPGFDALLNPYWFDTPMVIFEMALGVWLLFKGLRPGRPALPDEAMGRAQSGDA